MFWASAKLTRLWLQQIHTLNVNIGMWEICLCRHKVTQMGFLLVHRFFLLQHKDHTISKISTSKTYISCITCLVFVVKQIKFTLPSATLTSLHLMPDGIRHIVNIYSSDVLILLQRRKLLVARHACLQCHIIDISNI